MDGQSKAIQLQGIVHNASKLASLDGQCSDLVNLRYKDGSWRTAGEGKYIGSAIDKLGNKYTHLYIHANAKYHNVLGVRDGYLWWFADLVDATGDKAVEDPEYNFVLRDDPEQLTPVYNVGENFLITQNGHMLTVIDGADDFQFFVFNTSTGKYKEVNVDLNGSQADRTIYPFGKVHFNLSYIKDDEIEDDVPCADEKGWGASVPVTSISKYWKPTSTPGAAINSLDIEDISKFVKKGDIHDKMIELYDKAREKNLFTGYFFVCAAIELYDATLVYASNPVLIGVKEKTSSTQGCDVYSRNSAGVISTLSEYITDEDSTLAFTDMAHFINDENPKKRYLPNGTVVDSGTSLIKRGAPQTLFSGWKKSVGDGIEDAKPDRPYFSYIGACVSAPSYAVIKKTGEYVKDKTVDDKYALGETKMAYEMPVFSAGAYTQRASYWEGDWVSANASQYFGSKVHCVVRGARLCMHLKNTRILKDNEDVFSRIVILVTPEVRKAKVATDFREDGEIFVGSRQACYYTSEGTGSYGMDQHYLSESYDMAYCPPVNSADEIAYQLLHSNFYELRGYDKNTIGEIERNCIVDMDPAELKGVLGAIAEGGSNYMKVEGTNRYSYVPKYAYMYNGRLHIANYTTRQFHGYPVDQFQINNHSISKKDDGYFMRYLSRCEGNNDEYNQWRRDFTKWHVDSELVKQGVPVVIARTVLDTADGEQTVSRYISAYDIGGGENGRLDGIEDLGPLITFPDYRAKSMTIYIVMNVNSALAVDKYVLYAKKFDLKSMPAMNMAYYIEPNLRPIKISDFGIVSNLGDIIINSISWQQQLNTSVQAE